MSKVKLTVEQIRHLINITNHYALRDTSWLQQSGGAFHHESAEWVRTGKASCGAKIPSPKTEIRSPMIGQSNLCLKCLKLFEKGKV